MRTVSILKDVRNASLQFSHEVVGLTLDQISKEIIAKLAERRAKTAIIDNLKSWLAALATGGSVHRLQTF